MRRLVAVDPGNKTGIAFASESGGRVAIDGTVELPAMHAVTKILKMGPYDYIFIENFIPRQGAHSWQPEALYVIGALTWLFEERGLSKNLELQAVADAKRFSTNEKLERIGWKHTGGHDRDALRHMLLGSVRHRWVRGEDLLRDEET